jgi:hypothetical protein
VCRKCCGDELHHMHNCGAHKGPRIRKIFKNYERNNALLKIPKFGKESAGMLLKEYLMARNVFNSSYDNDVYARRDYNFHTSVSTSVLESAGYTELKLCQIYFTTRRS